VTTTFSLMPLLAQTTDVIGIPVIVASLSLVVLAIALSWWLGLRIEAPVTWASLRAAVQLIAVGFLLAWVFEAGVPSIWAWIWVVVMTGVAGTVMARRIPDGPNVLLPAMAAIAGSTAVSLAVVFGLGVFDLEPVTLVVVAGITLGNVLPTAVLAAKQVVTAVRERPESIEGLLALGFDRRAVVRQVAPPAARLALIPQVERTKVVGLIALPGALTGLLLAGVDPLDAVVPLPLFVDPDRFLQRQLKIRITGRIPGRRPFLIRQVANKLRILRFYGFIRIP